MTVFSEVFPILGFVGKDGSTAGSGTKKRAQAMLKELMLIRCVTLQNGESSSIEHPIRLFLCSDLCATWRILGNNATRFHCPCCMSTDLSQAGEARTDFPGSLVDVPRPEDGGVTAFVIPCMLHAWLRLANQRVRAIYDRCQRKDPGHSQKDAKALFEKLNIQFWCKTMRSECFLFTTRKMADRISCTEIDKKLADFEGIKDPAVWRRWYDLYSEVEKGVKPSEHTEFKMRALEAINAFTTEYSAEQLHIYQHIIAYHALDVQSHLRDIPLGLLANQRAEASHHDHKMLYTHHTFGNGSRFVRFEGEGEQKLVVTQRASPLLEVITRDLALKHYHMNKH